MLDCFRVALCRARDHPHEVLARHVPNHDSAGARGVNLKSIRTAFEPSTLDAEAVYLNLRADTPGPRAPLAEGNGRGRRRRAD
jgi:hypothetical protein